MDNYIKRLRYSLVLWIICIFAFSCGKYFPEKRQNIGSDATFNTSVFNPVLGRTTQFQGLFYAGSTTFPVEFKIINPRLASTGAPATELTTVYPVSAWKDAYTGTETSLAEIEDKKTTQYRTLLEIGSSSGDLRLWSAAKSSFVKTIPDSCYLFDVELSNSGGRRYFTDFRLQPYKERPFEPSNLNSVTGMPESNGIHPTTITNMTGDSLNYSLGTGAVDVFIRKLDDGTDAKNKLTFKFFDKQYRVIDPKTFALTDWKNLVHGFNMQMTDSSVSYDVSYPLPSAQLPTKYTNSLGSLAHTSFSYSRINELGILVNAGMTLDFAIYENGNWEIVFVFSTDTPKF